MVVDPRLVNGINMKLFIACIFGFLPWLTCVSPITVWIR
jgi:hypothetical protein